MWRHVCLGTIPRVFLLQCLCVLCCYVCCASWRSAFLSTPQIHYYQVVGRRLPTEMDPEPEMYRTRLFAPNPVTAKSRYWYFMHRLEKKKGTGEILSVNGVAIGWVVCWFRELYKGACEAKGKGVAANWVFKKEKSRDTVGGQE